MQHSTASWLAFLSCAWLLCPGTLARAQEKATAQTNAIPLGPTNPIVDLVLIYDGGEARPPWTPERFKPYVYRQADGKFEWLYDGFLFLDFLSPTGRRLCPITHRPDATKADWQAVLDHEFAPGQSVSALNQLLESLAAQDHKPLRKRKVVLALPTPLTGSDPKQIQLTSDWGELAGRRLDFKHTEDRLQAAQWYVDEVLKRWEQAHFQHLELGGFYWLFERAWGVHHTKEIGDYIRAKHSRLYWIPSWPQGRKNWPDYGFDFVYQQPNYFFHRHPTPDTRLEEACRFAESCGTSMEMEFNGDLLTKPDFLKYYDAYLEAYTQHQVWQKRPVAYYEGAGAWADMSVSKDPAVQHRYRALAQLIVKRQQEADTGFVFAQGAK